MNKRLISLMAAALALLSASGQVSFTGASTHNPIVLPIAKNSGTGLDSIFVVFDTQEVDMTFTAKSDVTVTWSSFGERGGGYDEPISGITRSGRETTLRHVLPNKGYIITEGTYRHYYWVVNYADYYMSLNGLSFSSEASCSLVSFNLDGKADAIPYYTINGNRQVLDRMIELTYYTQVWDDSTHWETKEVTDTFAALDQAFQIDPPLCNTVFVLSGDRFLKTWDLTQVVRTNDIYYPRAVSCGSTAVQEDRGYDNERGLDSGLGGSAPVHIVFTGYPSDQVAFRRWEMATDEDFNEVFIQYNQDEVDYTFNDAGTYYVRYFVANDDGSCENYGETYRIMVSESELVCPNVFSPGSTEGVNDVWKVSYKSLVEFHCWIFNRWGTCVCEFTDPGEGWDGKYKGRLVDTGVYYYVITALGSDGVKYKKRGDITILRYKRGAGGTSGDGTGGVDTGGY